MAGAPLTTRRRLGTNEGMFGRETMRVIPSKVRIGSADFRDRRAAMTQLIDNLEAALEEARAGGGEKYTTRHVARGKLLYACNPAKFRACEYVTYMIEPEQRCRI